MGSFQTEHIYHIAHTAWHGHTGTAWHGHCLAWALLPSITATDSNRTDGQMTMETEREGKRDRNNKRER